MEILLDVSAHAIEQFRFQNNHPDRANFTDEQIVACIRRLWSFGAPQSTEQYGWAHKFAIYGIEDSEHRKAANWLITRVNHLIVTVHFKTLQECRRDRKRRLRENQRLRGVRS